MNKSKFGVLGLIVSLGCLAFAQDAELADKVTALEASLAETNFALDTLSLLFYAVLVAFMQPGFALLEAGLHSAKNIVNIFMKNIMDFVVAGLAYWAVGFSIMYGAPLFIRGYEAGWVPGQADFFFQLVFAATAATIVSGAIGGRMKFTAYLIFSAVMTALIYPVMGSWKWGGGWLDQLGFADFAGSSIVHAVGGFAALGAVLAIGPRLGRYAGNKINAMPGHNMALAGFGVFLLWLGWFGFNPGSQLAFSTAADSTTVADIFINTNLAASAGALSAMILSWALFKKPDFTMTINGILAGLVTITAGCDVIVGGWAVVAGAIGGILVVFSVLMFDRLKVDDPVGAISVHGICGVWGTIAVGIFGGGNLGVQVLGTLVYAAGAFVSGYLIFMILKYTIGIRVTAEEEVRGLDIAEHGIEGYSPSDYVGDPVVLSAVAGD
ncbi:MAG: ammonium transporter [Trueperaceae bacterium]|nr:ammonium transporter [Trueperaceae bacterium]